jgi:hypothetical protein
VPKAIDRSITNDVADAFVTSLRIEMPFVDRSLIPIGAVKLQQAPLTDYPQYITYERTDLVPGFVPTPSSYVYFHTFSFGGGMARGALFGN